MIKQEKLKVLRATMALLRETIVKTGYKTGYKVGCCDSPLKELGYSTEDAINLLRVKRGDDRGKD